MNTQQIKRTIIGPFSNATIHIGGTSETQLTWASKANPQYELSHNEVHFIFKNIASSKLQQNLLQNRKKETPDYFLLPEEDPKQELFIWIDNPHSNNLVDIFSCIDPLKNEDVGQRHRRQSKEQPLPDLEAKL